jgi:hypothetical protein
VPVDGFAGAGFAPEDWALEDLPRDDLPGDGFALFGGILVAGDLATDFTPEGLSAGDSAGRGFMNIGTSAGRCLRKRRACFTTDFLRDRERAIKPHTHTTCPDGFCSCRHLSRAFPLAEHQTKYVLK